MVDDMIGKWLSLLVLVHASSGLNNGEDNRKAWTIPPSYQDEGKVSATVGRASYSRTEAIGKGAR